jgi:hypothetical protein
MSINYETPEVTEYGAVEAITQDGGTNKAGDGGDEYSEGTTLTGSTFTTK